MLIDIHAIKVDDILQVQAISRGKDVQMDFTKEEFHEWVDGMWPHLGTTIKHITLDMEFNNGS